MERRELRQTPEPITSSPKFTEQQRLHNRITMERHLRLCCHRLSSTGVPVHRETSRNPQAKNPITSRRFDL